MNFKTKWMIFTAVCALAGCEKPLDYLADTSSENPANAAPEQAAKSETPRRALAPLYQRAELETVIATLLKTLPDYPMEIWAGGWGKNLDRPYTFEHTVHKILDDPDNAGRKIVVFNSNEDNCHACGAHASIAEYQQSDDGLWSLSGWTVNAFYSGYFGNLNGDIRLVPAPQKSLVLLHEFKNGNQGHFGTYTQIYERRRGSFDKVLSFTSGWDSTASSLPATERSDWTSNVRFVPNDKKPADICFHSQGIEDGTEIDREQCFTKARREYMTRSQVSGPPPRCVPVIGMIYADTGNGDRDNRELGIAGIKLKTRPGDVITSDAQGRFQIACAQITNLDIRSRALIEIDTDSLPEGYRLTSPNPVTIHLNPDKMTKLYVGLKRSAD